MEVRPGYKQTEAGAIPEQWVTTTLSASCVQGGVVRGPFGGALKKEMFVKAGRKVYEQKNAIQRDATIGSYYISEAKFKELQRFSVRPGDFIISCAGTIGRIFRVPPDAQPGVINQALLKLRIDEEVVCSDYFYLYFGWDTFQQRIVDNTHGGAMQNLVGMSLFRSVELGLPPIPEQRTIAAALNAVDALLAGLDQLVVKKRDLKEAAMQKLLTGQTRLPGFHGDWKVKRLGNTALLKARIGWQGLTTAEYLESGDYYLVTGTEFNNGRIDWNSCHYVDESRYMQDKYIQLKKHDVLVTKDGTIGKVAIISDLPRPATLNSGVFVVRPIDSAFHPEFFYWLLCSTTFKDFLTQLSAGSTINHLYQKDFVTFDYRVPATIEEQAAVAAALSEMDAELSALEARRDKTRALQHGMMHELLTGKTRLVPTGVVHV